MRVSVLRLSILKIGGGLVLILGVLSSLTSAQIAAEMPSMSADSQLEFNRAVTLYENQQYVEAAELFDSLANQGHLDAQNNLATLFQTGRGVPKNYVEAAKYYLLAAQGGHLEAAANLSTLYRLGVGVKKDLLEAYMWAVIAARQGDSEMLAERDMIGTHLKPEQREASIAKAHQRLEALTNRELEMAWLMPTVLASTTYNPVTIQPSASSIPPPEDIPDGFHLITPKTPSTPTSAPAIPEGFKLVTPALPSGEGVPWLNKPNPLTGQALPAGFNLIRPKNAPALDAVPAGFTMIRPKETADIDAPNLAVTQHVTMKAQAQLVDAAGQPIHQATMRATSESMPAATPLTTRHILPAYPSRINHAGLVLYRPGKLPAQLPKNTTLIRPRRELPAKILPIAPIPLDDELRTVVINLARTYDVSLSQMVAALRVYNHDAFEARLPLKLKPSMGLIIPDRQQILKTPIAAASLSADEAENTDD